jgi:hypothetical protein
MSTGTIRSQNDVSEPDFIAAKGLAFACLSAAEGLIIACNNLSKVGVDNDEIDLMSADEIDSMIPRAVEHLCKALDSTGIQVNRKPSWRYQTDWNESKTPSKIGRVKHYLMACKDNGEAWHECNTAHEMACRFALEMWHTIERIVTVYSGESKSHNGKQDFYLKPDLVDRATCNIWHACTSDRWDNNFKKAKAVVEKESVKALALWKSDRTESNGNNKPIKQSKYVQLFGQSKEPVVKGQKKERLTQKQYNTIQALIEAGDNGLTKDELDQNSGHIESRKALTDLGKKDPDWKEVIVMAERTGNRYHIQ